MPSTITNFNIRPIYGCRIEIIDFGWPPSMPSPHPPLTARGGTSDHEAREARGGSWTQMI